MEEIFKVIELGNIFFNGKMQVTDPCYSTDVWCTKQINIKKGEYIAKAVMYDCGDWGKRIGELTINHISCPKKKANNRVYSSIGVDSGQCGFFDYDKYEKVHPTYFVDETEESKKWYDKVCNITLNGDWCGLVDDMGVVSSSGIGDGCYNLYAGYNNKDEIVALRLKFL